MNSPTASAGGSDPRINDAILHYLKAEDQGTPISAETWLKNAPEELRPQLRDFLDNHLSQGSPKRPEPDKESPTPFGKYADFVLLARGGMGSIYRCRDKQLGRNVAMKVMLKALASHPDMARRFRAEALIASRVDHPGTAAVHDFGEISDGRPYFTMRWIDGDTLLRRIQQYHRARTTPGLHTLLRQFIAVCGVLVEAHARGFLHRDLKPANIMVGKHDEVLLLDWGLAKSFPESSRADEPNPGQDLYNLDEDEVGALRTQLGTIRGTLSYMPPEQADPDHPPLNERCDIFALGAILCQILIGRPPYVSGAKEPNIRRLDLLQQARQGLVAPALRELRNNDCPAQLYTLIESCLCLDRNKRPESVRAVAAAVTSYLESLQQAERRKELENVSASTRSREWVKRRRVWLLVGVILSVAILGTVGSVLWYKKDRQQLQQDRLQSQQVVEAQSKDSIAEAISYIEHDDPVRAEQSLADVERIPGFKDSSELQGRKAEVERALRLYQRLQQQRQWSTLFHRFALGLPAGSAGYKEVFDEFGFSLQSPEEFTRKAKASPAHRTIASAIDHWAVLENSNKELRPKLLQLAQSIEPAEGTWIKYRTIQNWDSAAKALDLTRTIQDVDLTPFRATMLNLMLRQRNVERKERMDFLERKKKQFGKEYEFLLELGNHYAISAFEGRLSRIEFERAADNYLEAIKSTTEAGNSIVAHLNRAYVLRMLARWNEADEEYRHVTDTFPDMILPHISRSEFLFGRGLFKEAWDEYQRAVAIDPASLMHKMIGSILWSEKGDQGKADACIREILARPNPGALPHLLLGMILTRQGKWDAALEAMEKAKEKGREEPLFHTLTEISLNGGKENVSIIDIMTLYVRKTIKEADRRQAANLKPFPLISDQLISAELHFLHGSWSKAVDEFEKVFASHSIQTKIINPDRAQSLLWGLGYHTIAARSALLLANSGKVSAQRKDELRKKALEWLRIDLAQLRKQQEKNKGPISNFRDSLTFQRMFIRILMGEGVERLIGEESRKIEFRRSLGLWQLFDEFTDLRDPAPGSLGDSERADWGRFWKEVAELYEQLRKE